MIQMDFHPREKFVTIVPCPAELVSEDGTTHQCWGARNHPELHTCSCGQHWENALTKAVK